MIFEIYIQGLFPITIPEATLGSVMFNRGIQSETEVFFVSEKSRELAFADICVYFSRLPSGYTGSKDSDNGWSHTESSYSLTASDKAVYRAEANGIYLKYGETSKYKPSLKIRSLNGTPYYGE